MVTRSPRPPAIPERAIQADILSYLRLRGFYTLRLNAGALPNAQGRPVRIAPAGTPDVCFGLAVDGLTYLAFVEVKRVGGVQSVRQKLCQQELDARGIPYILATSVDDVDTGIVAFTRRVRARPLGPSPLVAYGEANRDKKRIHGDHT